MYEIYSFCMWSLFIKVKRNKFKNINIYKIYIIIRNMVDIEHSGREEHRQSFTIFGEPVIKTKCQRNAFITAITGGIICGLISFLITSNSKKSTRIGVASYGAIGISCAIYCAVDEINTRNELKKLMHLMYETSKSDNTSNKNKKLVDVWNIFESVWNFYKICK